MKGNMRERILAFVKELKFLQDATDLEWSNPVDCIECSFVINADDQSVTYTFPNGDEWLAESDGISDITQLGGLVFYPSQDEGLLIFDMDNYSGDPDDAEDW